MRGTGAARQIARVMSNPWTVAQQVFQKTLIALRARVSGIDVERALEPLALGLLAGANMVIGATRHRLESAREIAQALADVIELQAGPTFTLTEAVSRRHTGLSLTGDIGFKWGDTSYNVPSAIALNTRLVILDDLSRLTPGVLHAVEGWLGQEDRGILAYRELRHGVKLAELLTVLAIVDVDHPLLPSGQPFSARLAHFFDIGVSLDDEDLATPPRQEQPSAHRHTSDQMLTVDVAEIADFRAAATDVELPHADGDAELLGRAVDRMDHIGFYGPAFRTSDIARACAAARGQRTADQSDWQRAVTLRECAYAALYNRRPAL
jgi:hypothetical protein